MKHSTTTRILLAIFALAMVFTTSYSQPAAPIPGCNIIIKKNPGSVAIQAASNDGKGKYTFNDLKKGSYDILLVAPAEYFAAKKIDTANVLTAEYELVPTPAHQTRAFISTTRSNIKHNKKGIAVQNSDMQTGLTKMTVEGKTVYAKVLFEDVNIQDTVGAMIVIVKNTFGINEPGVK